MMDVFSRGNPFSEARRWKMMEHPCCTPASIANGGKRTKKKPKKKKRIRSSK